MSMWRQLRANCWASRLLRSRASRSKRCSDMPLSPVLQALVDKGLFDRLPATFSTFFFQQLQDWNLMFPAEQSYHERLFTLIDRTEAQAVEQLFAPLREVERLMGVNEKTWPRRSFSLDQVDFLNRSAHNQDWRKAIADV